MKDHHMLNSTFCKDPMRWHSKKASERSTENTLSILKVNVDDLAKKIEASLKHEESYYN
jgi:hypothetical protein